MDDKKPNSVTPIIVAIISASAACIVAVIGILQPLVSRWVDNNFPINTPLALTNVASETPIFIPSTVPTQVSVLPSSFPVVATEAVVIVSNTPEENLPPSKILFNEDFEDGKAQQIQYSDKEWKIIPDETGNSVYDIDNSASDEYKRFYLGSNSWKDYEVNFRARIVSGSRVVVCFRENELDYSNYVANIQSNMVTLEYSTHGTDLKVITSHQYSLRENEWYLVNVQAVNSEIKVTINGEVVIFTDDTKHLYGRVVFQAAPYTHIQYDDIVVTSK